MVDFLKRLGKGKTKRPLDPIEIYDTLDRASDKGPLRPAQESIFQDWHEHRREEQDLLVKLQTGQGKTLIGLLMLQSRLNEGRIVDHQIDELNLICGQGLPSKETRRRLVWQLLDPSRSSRAQTTLIRCPNGLCSTSAAFRLNRRVRSIQGYHERCRKREMGIAAEPDAAIHPKPRFGNVKASPMRSVVHLQSARRSHQPLRP
jgi:hypothetical protein